MSAYGETIAKDGSITSAHERMFSPYGEIKRKLINITSPYGLTTSPYDDKASLLGIPFKSYDNITSPYGKTANSYFFAIMYIYMLMPAQDK
jgi:hypothetical protein